MFAWQNVLYMYYWELKWFWILCSIMTNGLIVKRWKWWTNTWNRIHFPTTRATISLVKNGHLPLFLSVSLFAMNTLTLSLRDVAHCLWSLFRWTLETLNTQFQIANFSHSLSHKGASDGMIISLCFSRSLSLQWTISLPTSHDEGNNFSLGPSLCNEHFHSLSERCRSLSLLPLPLDSWNPKHPISNRKFLSLSLAQRGFRRNDHLSLFLPVSLSAMNNLTTHFPRRGQQFLSRSLPLQWTLSLSLWAMSLTLFAPSSVAPSSVGLFKP